MSAFSIRQDTSFIAYFSMEIGLEPGMPTYSGGLGVLAGDTLRAAADLGVPMVAVTMLYRKGHFHQHLDAGGNQTESPSIWYPEQFLEPMPARISVTVEGRPVQVRAWRYDIRGAAGRQVPVFFLDTALRENGPFDQTLTDHLYGGDEHYRLCQETVLGLGGVAMLRALGYDRVRAYHMNEGHSALLTLALLSEQIQGRGLLEAADEDRNEVRKRCVFTTHTPVPAGHDQFPLDLVRRVLGDEKATALEAAHCYLDGKLNMTYLALFFSHYINGVAMRHGEISRGMFPHYPIDSITNGVHAVTWATKPFRELFDRHIPEWRRDNLYLRYALGIPLADIRQAHEHAKIGLFAEIAKRKDDRLDPDAFTIGFARRAAAYKRADMLFTDRERLKRIVREAGPIQLVFAGKAHPRDDGGKAIIRRVFEAARELKDVVKVVYLEEYDMGLAKHICGGVDLWLNNPMKPREASGTSGMKAAINGVPSLSVQDGWWIEGCVEGVTGWSIGEDWNHESVTEKEVESLYRKLERVVLPMFYKKPDAYAEVMRSAIALNGSFFNTQRMVFQYLENAYAMPPP